MDELFYIESVKGRQILDSRGNPTVEAEVRLSGGAVGRASVPSGASTGKFEAVELRDGKDEWKGLGVTRAVNHVNEELSDAICGYNALDQLQIDSLLCSADKTENKENLGANAILGVSMATARACANALEIPLYRYLGGFFTPTMPVPMMNILNGGKHADNTVDLQEFMIMPVGACCFPEAIRMCTEIYHTLKKILKDKNLSTAVGDEGGFAPELSNSEEVLSYIVEAIEKSGYQPGSQVAIALDAAASELYDEQRNGYYFAGEETVRSSEEMIDYFKNLCNQFPIVSIEDGLEEEDFTGWQLLTKELGSKVQLVGDDLFVTNTKRLKKGIELQAANAILIKVNQIGTLSESFDAIRLAQSSGYKTVISHRSGETEDAIIADIAVAVGAGQIKTGAPCRAERTAKYNQLFRICEELGKNVRFFTPFS
jgi:enolase